MENRAFHGEEGQGRNGRQHTRDLPTYDAAVYPAVPGPVDGNQRRQAGPVKKTYKKTKSVLQDNPYTNPFFPPNGEVATTLTLILTIIAIFFTARTVLGPIADIGGTVFALLMLILVALIGGKLVLGLGWLIKKTCGVEIRLPPLLGMLIVGIILKNVPYNFGQFGRAECTIDKYGVHHNASGFHDSIHELDLEIRLEKTEDSSFRRRRSAPDLDVPLNLDGEEMSEALVKRWTAKKEQLQKEWEMSGKSWEMQEQLLKTAWCSRNKTRVTRSAGGGGHEEAEAQSENVDDCHPKYIGHDLDPSISRTLRSICLAVILLMAGLELDPVALMKLSAMVVRATFIPCFVEAIMVAVLSNLVLGLPWTVGFMLGFVLAAVSPAVIIPSLMSLSQRGFGVAKGIPTLVIAACSADDVVAISGFGIFFGLTFNASAPVWKLALHGPIEVLIGLVFGVFWGILAQWIPNKEHRHVEFFRWLVLLGGGLIALFGAHLIHYDGAGGLATIILAFVAGMQWRKEGWGDHNPVMKTFKRMWIILEPVIFALIGTEIQVHKIDFAVLGYSLIVLVGALVIRMIGTYFAVTCGTLTTKEKIFMAFAWLPKATVQAALGPIFLDNVLKQSQSFWVEVTGDVCCDENWIDGTDMAECLNPMPGDWISTKAEWTGWGENILTLAVLSILITAPLGAISILALGPKLLEADPAKAEDNSSDDIESSH